MADELRNAWLNPPDLVRIEPEVYPTPEQRAAGAKPIYPDRILPKDANAAAILRERTLTNLYNQRPQWLADAHRDLDAAVAVSLWLAGRHFRGGRAHETPRAQPRPRRRPITAGGN